MLHDRASGWRGERPLRRRADRCTRCTTTRRIGSADRTNTNTSEITEISRPTSWPIRVIDGPIRAVLQVTVEPRQNGEQSHVTFSLDFSGHGLGKLILSRVISRAREEMLRNCQKLKQRLEGTS